jgi:hypothetical protein
MASARTLKALGLMLLFLGLISLFASAIYTSYVTAFIGLGLTFWGALLLLVVPTKHVRLELLTAASSSPAVSFEELLTATAFNSKGIYLPPRLLRDFQSSLVFIPIAGGEILPEREDVPEKGMPRTSMGLFLTPPGLALSKLFEKQLGKSFTELNLDQLAKRLPSLLEKLEISKNTDVLIEDNIVTVEVENHIFKDLIVETERLKKTREAAGSPFSSAIACAVAKAAGEPVVLEHEGQSTGGKVSIRLRIVKV